MKLDHSLQMTSTTTELHRIAHEIGTQLWCDVKRLQHGRLPDDATALDELHAKWQEATARLRDLHREALADGADESDISDTIAEAPIS
ncbi:hypothetical protein C1Y63_04940 [Corynebacterium sp. 13CS0277]|uniref:hypothetical protein n=1 Tax=Corynebacterium sp. 13CS0277 TaxID=2071994 RepID=UPI000D02CD4A|nr:hypothetical protein [Corynebacterium sp. 13CS0277]PRQ11758.1 hypothetical protein C1Y63_04940 [Corynebacterium sp. 13CS0277]